MAKLLQIAGNVLALAFAFARMSGCARQRDWTMHAMRGVEVVSALSVCMFTWSRTGSWRPVNTLAWNMAWNTNKQLQQQAG